MTTLPGIRTSLTLDSSVFVAEIRHATKAVDDFRNQVEERSNRISKGFSTAQKAAHGLASGIAAIGAGRFFSSLVDATTALEKINNTLLAGTGFYPSGGRGVWRTRASRQKTGMDPEVVKAKLLATFGGEIATAWQHGILARRPIKVAVLAQAAKTARIAWAVLTSGEAYQAHRQARPVKAAQA